MIKTMFGVSIIMSIMIIESYATVPVMMWSPEHDVVSSKIGRMPLVGESTSVRDVMDLLQFLVGKNTDAQRLENQLCGENKVSTQVVFVVDQLNQKDLSELFQAYSDKPMDPKSVLHSSSDPVVFSTTSLANSENEWMQWAKSKIYYETQGASDSFTSLKASIEKVSADEPLEILVNLGDLDSSDLKSMQKVCELLGSRSYVAVLTGLGETEQTFVPLSSIERRALADVYSATTLPIRNTPFIISSMLISLMLFSALLVYLYCMDSVSAPSRFITKYPAKGKVFE